MHGRSAAHPFKSHEMKFKKTRIAFSVFCSIVTLLLVGLTVRSYWKRDCLQLPLPISRHLFVWSMQGQITFLSGDLGIEPMVVSTNIYVRWYPTSASKWCRYESKPGSTLVSFPHSLLILVLSVLAATPWLERLPRQFSLRTLLIVMTAVAVGLWYIMWMARK